LVSGSLPQRKVRRTPRLIKFVTDPKKINEYLWFISTEVYLMILKELRISRHFSQEQIAQMSGLNVRTIQRIESGKNPSIESLKFIASALDVGVSTLNQEKFMIDKNSDNWKTLPFLMKIWLRSNFIQNRPTRIEIMLHMSGFLSCCLSLISEVVLPGGLMLLATAYLVHLVNWQGDKYGIWYDNELAKSSIQATQAGLLTVGLVSLRYIV